MAALKGRARSWPTVGEHMKVEPQGGITRTESQMDIGSFCNTFVPRVDADGEELLLTSSGGSNAAAMGLYLRPEWSRRFLGQVSKAWRAC